MEYSPKGEKSTNTFEVIFDLLKEQDNTTQHRSKETDNASEDTSTSTLGNFFSFELLVSSHLIQIIYVLGAIAITIVCWNSFMGEQLIAGIMSIIVGNLVWRLGCETLIVFFRMNKQLAQLRLIHKELKQALNKEGVGH